MRIIRRSKIVLENSVYGLMEESFINISLPQGQTIMTAEEIIKSPVETHRRKGLYTILKSIVITWLAWQIMATQQHGAMPVFRIAPLGAKLPIDLVLKGSAVEASRVRCKYGLFHLPPHIAH
ncbi:hypothetical protein F5Y08DRAFT_342748 [Xylaria arbuscula]|nr:hypothetical protein F5Y08DRAFT_342748 [Xylaria arbuscula]